MNTEKKIRKLPLLVTTAIVITALGFVGLRHRSTKKNDSSLLTSATACASELSSGACGGQVIEQAKPKEIKTELIKNNLQVVTTETKPYDSPENFLISSLRLLKDGRVEDAIELLKKGLSQNPNNDEILTELGFIYMTNIKDTQQAENYFQKAVKANPNNDHALSRLVGIYEEQRNSQKALTLLTELQKANPNSTEASLALGELLMRQGRLDEAIPFLERAASTAKDSVLTRSRIAETFLATGNPEGAIEQYKRAIEHQRTEVEKLREKGASVEYGEQYLAELELNMAGALIQKGDYSSAEALISKARQAIPNDPMIEELMNELSVKRNG